MVHRQQRRPAPRPFPPQRGSPWTARLSFIAILATGCSSESARPITLAVVTGLAGTTAPCGCTSRPLGGLDKLATQVAKLDSPAAVVFAGSTFFTHADPPPGLLEQEQRKADAIAEIVAKLDPVALLPGPLDHGRHGEHLRGLARRHGLALFTRPRSLRTHARADSSLHTIGGIKVGFVGVAGDPSGEADSYTHAALALRAQGADIVIALIASGGAVGPALASRIDACDIAIGGGSDHLRAPRVIGGTLYVDAGDRGRYLGLLRLHPQGGGKKDAWAYDDGGKSQRASLDARIEQLQEAAARLNGKARAVRQKKVTQLTAQRDAIELIAPKGRYVSWETITITDEFPAAPWARKTLDSYNQSLCAITTRATQEIACAPAATPQDRYVGTAACRACHGAAFSLWEQTKHANAWQTLVEANKTCDLGCIGCHSVGYDRPGGYCHLSDAQEHANVGCETCHGPAAGHLANPGDREAWGTAFTGVTSPETCLSCHNAEHSDAFSYDTYRRKIVGAGHGWAFVPAPQGSP